MHVIVLLNIICASFCFENYRLPSSIKPHHYNLRLLTHLNDYTRLFFTGDVEIHLHILQATNNITLHVGSRLNIDTTGIWMQSVASKCHKDIAIKGVERDSKFDFYILHLNTQLWPSQRYVLRLPFWARLCQTLSGYYASSYQNECGQTRFISITQFEPTDARTAFPCFDEPNLKATFNITLGHHKHYNALSNMPLAEKIPMCERRNWVWSIFRQTEIMSTYLVAFSINDFAGYASYNDPYERQVKFITWAQSSAIEQCKYAAEIGPRLMAYYEQLFGISYPLPKMDQLAVPDFSAGAMENWGLITYREASLLYAEEASSLLDKQRVTNIIAHELAHQWFGNLVTMEWWNDLWLNEGFATYVATLGMNALCSNWHAYEEESVENVLAILYTDSFCNTRPIHQPSVRRGSQIAELFDVITYRKGAVIIRMMHFFIGDKAFKRGLNSYLQKHSFINAKQQDLWLQLTEAAHLLKTMPHDLDVQIVMDTWTFQPGIPLISVQRHYFTKSATITQSRYRMYDEVEPPKMNESPLQSEPCWFVPISYTTDSQSNFVSTEPRAWLRCQGGEVLPLELLDLPYAQEWLILNVQLATPYRINYDTGNWELIIKGLQSGVFKRIHVMNRAQLLDDSLSLAWSGHLSYALALKLLGYLKHEHEFIPWRAALNQLSAIERIMRQTSEFEEFQHFMNHLLDPIYNYLGGIHEDADNRHHVAHKTLINRWACRLNQADCVKGALKYYHRWFILNNPDESNPVPQNLRTVIYCTAVQHGDADDWNFFWRRYTNSSVASEKRLILLSLSCSRKVDQIEHYLKVIFREKSLIRKQDVSQIFEAIVRNDIGFHIAKDFVMHKFEKLKQFYESNRRELAALLVKIAQNINCQRDYQQMRTFIETQKQLLESSMLILRRALEQAQLNLRWRQKRISEFSSNLYMHCYD
ncbi:aminopeptidase N-like isoform X1 [Drosophila nasuta]|uniref:aminopeptidase N-like isoform X1 n=2 Tax=Drosophila nasuta TaxID=42062 RepID=UPI00295E979F|nr:aminopeptidase N-like isoform X1 [Drosophila nasuta]